MNEYECGSTNVYECVTLVYCETTSVLFHVCLPVNAPPAEYTAQQICRQINQCPSYKVLALLLLYTILATEGWDS